MGRFNHMHKLLDAARLVRLELPLPDGGIDFAAVARAQRLRRHAHHGHHASAHWIRRLSPFFLSKTMNTLERNALFLPVPSSMIKSHGFSNARQLVTKVN